MSKSFLIYYVYICCRESSAELNQVCWLEVTGSVEGTRPNKQYQVGFHVSFTPDAFGWGGSPLYIMVKRGKDGKPVWRKLLLNPHQTKECDITATTNPHSNDPKLYFGLYELWSGKWKGGLKIHHAFIRQLPWSTIYVYIYPTLFHIYMCRILFFFLTPYLSIYIYTCTYWLNKKRKRIVILGDAYSWS